MLQVGSLAFQINAYTILKTYNKIQPMYHHYLYNHFFKFLAFRHWFDGTDLIWKLVTHWYVGGQPGRSLRGFILKLLPGAQWCRPWVSPETAESCRSVVGLFLSDPRQMNKETHRCLPVSERPAECAGAWASRTYIQSAVWGKVFFPELLHLTWDAYNSFFLNVEATSTYIIKG